jgi:hypothetical protein
LDVSAERMRIRWVMPPSWTDSSVSSFMCSS